MSTEQEMRDRAIGAAAYWLDCSEHEQTPEDAKILARYARLAIDRIMELETMVHERPTIDEPEGAMVVWSGIGGPVRQIACGRGKIYGRQEFTGEWMLLVRGPFMD